MLVATIVLAPVLLLRRATTATRSRVTRRPLMLAALAGIFFALDLALFNTAVLRTSAANATLLGNNAPILVGIATWLVFGRRPPSAFWIGLGLAVVGSACIMGDDALRHTTAFGIGDAMAITASVFFAGYLLTVERVRAHVDTLTLTTLTVSVSSATLLLLCLALRVPLTGFTTHAWLDLIGLGIVSQVGGYLSITYALGHLPATVTSVGLLAQAPLTAVLAIPLLGEPLRTSQILGGVLVLSGIYVVNRRTAAAL